MIDIEEIRKVATEVRHAMEQLKAEKKLDRYGYPFTEFPSACCGDMSIILTTHFNNLGYGLADYICGAYFDHEREINIYHAWIKLDGICIDITSDQFKDENNDNVIVELEENFIPMRKYIPEKRSPWSITIDTANQSEIYKLICDLINSKSPKLV